jgi:hypothetical protein
VISFKAEPESYRISFFCLGKNPPVGREFSGYEILHSYLYSGLQNSTPGSRSNAEGIAMSQGSPEKAFDEGGHTEVKRLVEVYATRAREFYEAVAALGGHLATGKSLDAAVAEIKRLRIRCEEAGSDLFVHLMSQQTVRPPGGGAKPGPGVETKGTGAPGE